MFSAMFSSHGVLGLNARNLLYVRPYNRKKAVAIADDKLKTKAFLTARGIPAARIFAKLENREQVRSFNFAQLPDQCVLKPNYGFGGEGIVVLNGRDKKGRFLRSGKVAMTDEELREHMEDILDGKYSLGGRRDTPFFEQLLISHDCFARFRPVGMPDLRIIVFNLVPVMAMVRIPTAESEGKANVHLGGIGIGIDIAKGVTTHATQYNRMITELPHGGSPGGITIPYWDDILLISSRIQQITNIGYLAADITIDQQMGPAVLEVNARAGLMVQVANLAPLRKRLERVKGLQVSTPEKGVRMGQDLFGEKVRGGKTPPHERPVLGLREVIVIAGVGTSKEEPCLITPEQERTIFSASLLAELSKRDIVELEDEKERTYRVKFTLGGKKLQTLVTEGETEAGVRATIGRRDLSGYLIDPGRKHETKLPTAVKSDLRALDKLLAQLDRDLLLLKYLKPVNLDEERQRLTEDDRYNPVFSYRELEFDVAEVRERLEAAKGDSSPLGKLLEKKRRELIVRLDVLAARGDAAAFTQASIALFGKPTPSLLRAAKDMIAQRLACELPQPASLTPEQAKEKFMQALARYSLHDWHVEVRPRLVADVTIGGKSVYVRGGAQFAPDHVEALIKHEIETHVLTAENGEHQPYALFRRGCAGYLDTQEGLATYNQNQVYGLAHDKRYNAPRNVLGLQFALKNSFADTRQYLNDVLDYSPAKALTQAIAMKRGLQNTEDEGAFTKSIVYFRGLQAVEEYVAAGGDLQRLYIGRITLADLELAEQVPDLQPPLLIPEFLRGAEK